MTLGQPAGAVQIKSLAGRGKVQRVEMVGASGPLPFHQDGAGLHVTVPAGASHSYGLALRINGEGLV